MSKYNKFFTGIKYSSDDTKRYVWGWKYMHWESMMYEMLRTTCLIFTQFLYLLSFVVLYITCLLKHVK